MPFDLERAHQLLTKAGYPGGEGFPKVEALSSRLATYFEAVLESWRSKLGVETRYETVEWGVLLERIHKEGDLPNIYTLAWTADYPDPDAFMRLGVNTATIWTNETYDALVAQARKTMDEEERMSLYRQSEEILVRERPSSRSSTSESIF
jgi:oligopeptide transport system substrate-binding protein